MESLSRLQRVRKDSTAPADHPFIAIHSSPCFLVSANPLQMCVSLPLYPYKPEFLVSEVVLCIYLVLYSFAFEEYSFLHLIIRRDECKLFSNVELCFQNSEKYMKK
jgi:hypothetical protein